MREGFIRLIILIYTASEHRLIDEYVILKIIYGNITVR